MFTLGSDSVLDFSPYVLLLCAVVAFALSRLLHPCKKRLLTRGLLKSASQILPAVPILLLIATVSTTWMLGGIVPTIIDYGLRLLNHEMFLIVACLVCSVISVLVGSSWTTCATIGVAFMGIGTVMGYNPAWVAGAVISGAYFGDKVSPLSDTTILASSTAGVNLFTHVKYLMITTVPSMVLALIVFGVLGFTTGKGADEDFSGTLATLAQVFHTSAWLLLAPVITCVLIVRRVRVLITLFISTLMGLVGLVLFQPELFATLSAAAGGSLVAVVKLLCTSTSVETGDDMLNSLVATGGLMGMMGTVKLILCAMLFGGTMLGTGMLQSITTHLNRHLRGLRKIVSATVGAGLLVNSCTGDQYLSIIVTGNLYKSLYQRNRLEPRLLSRSLEDSVSVTSVLIPWNSCGMTQSAVLGVDTVHYLPYCVFNYLCPLMSIAIASVGYKIVRKAQAPA